MLVFSRARCVPVLGLLLWALVAAPCEGLIATSTGAGSASRLLPDAGAPAPVDASAGVDAPLQVIDAGSSVLDAAVATIDAQPVARCGPIDQSSLVLGQYPALLSSGADVYLGSGPGVWYLPSDSPTARLIAGNGYMIAADVTHVYYVPNDGARTLTGVSVHGLPTKTFPWVGSNVLASASNGTTLFVTTDDPDAGGLVYTVLGIDVATGAVTTVGTIDNPNQIFAADVGHVYFDNVNSVARMGFDGTLSPFVSTNRFSAALQLDGAWIYAGSSDLQRAPSDLSTGFTPFTQAAGVSAMDADATDLYFTTTTVDEAGLSGSIERVPLDGSSPPTAIASGAGTAIAVSDECVVWTTSQGIYRTPKH